MTHKGLIAVDRINTSSLAIFKNLLHQISLTHSVQNSLQKHSPLSALPNLANQPALEKGVYKGRKYGVWYRSVKLFALGIVALSVTLVRIANAIPVTLHLQITQTLTLGVKQSPLVLLRVICAIALTTSSMNKLKALHKTTKLSSLPALT